MARIMVIGEGMLELSDSGSGWRLEYGGDTLNTAIHLARFGHDVVFATALGADRFSDDLRRRWRDEGLDISQVLTDPDRLPGLYAIRTDRTGERSFTYWRGESAARNLFSLPESGRLTEAVDRADMLLFSLISLAILPAPARTSLFDLCRRLKRRGGRIAFDGNYRPILWRDAADALEARNEAISLCDIGLPTLDDETALTGTLTAEKVAKQWRLLGAGETIVKLGSEGCLVDERTVSPAARLSPVDTSGAGDAFNAGYLNARLVGAHQFEAARRGHDLAAWTLMRRGAAPPSDPSAPYHL